MQAQTKQKKKKITTRTKFEPKVLACSEVVEQVGRRLYGTLWQNGDATASLVLSYEEATSYSNILKAYEVEVTVSGVKQFIFETEEFRDFDENDEEIRPPQKVYDAARKLLPTLQYLNNNLSEDQNPFFQAYMRRRKAEQKILDDLCNGSITASQDIHKKGRHSSELLDTSFWRRLRSKLNEKYYETTLSELAESERVSFSAQEIHAYSMRLNNREATGKICRDWLIELMKNATKRELKESVRKQFRNEVGYIAEDPFDREWSAACKETNSGWGKKGRPRKHGV